MDPGSRCRSALRGLGLANTARDRHPALRGGGHRHSQIAAKDKNIADIGLVLPLMMRITENTIVSLPLL
jgi:hypothetical protein